MIIPTKRTKVLKDKYVLEAKYESFYTGRTILASQDGSRLYCHNGCQVAVLDLASGRPLFFLKKEDEPVHTFALPPSEKFVLLACQSYFIHQFDASNGKFLKSWRTLFNGPVHCMDMDKTSMYLATGGNFEVKVYDLVRHQYTHFFKVTQGVVSVAKFRQPEEDPSIQQLVCAGMECDIHVLDLLTKSTVAKLTQHNSTVTSLDFSHDHSRMASSSRDKLAIIWDTSNWTPLRMMPILEPIESVFFLPTDKLYPALNCKKEAYYILTAGSQGRLKVWNTANGKLVFAQKESPLECLDDSENENITKAAYIPTTDSVMVATADKNILFFNLTEGLSLSKQMVGYWGPINCVRFVGPDSQYLALASSSHHVALHRTDTFQCQLLTGHTDLVLALDTFLSDPCLLVSAGKDNMAFVWRLNPETGKAVPIFKATGHIENVNAVVCMRNSTKYFATAGLDCMLKLWEMKKEDPSKKVLTLNAVSSAMAHEKEINAIDISPNDDLIATASRDKSVKLWTMPNLVLRGTLTGHRQGIFDVKFCPTKPQVASASKDHTVKIWSLDTLDCLKTIQDHQSPVLSLAYLKTGLQLAASDGDGVVRVFDLSHNVWHKSMVLSDHNAGIHSLALPHDHDNLMVSSDFESALILWKDVTKEERKKALAHKQEDVEKLQDLSNCIADRKWTKALKLALQLEKAVSANSILTEFLKSSSRSEHLAATLAELTNEEKGTLEKYCRHWVTNTKYYKPVVYILPILYQLHHYRDLMEICPSFKEHLPVFKIYLERHLDRNRKQTQANHYIYHVNKRSKIVEA